MQRSPTSFQASKMKAFCYLFLTLFCISTAKTFLNGHHGFSREISVLPHDVVGSIDYRHLASCLAVVAKEQCNNGEVQEAATQSLKCNQTQGAEALRDSCRKNSFGTYCGLTTSLMYVLSDNYTEFCRGNSCPKECKDLLTFVREELGCCANVMLNSTSSLYANLDMFKYSLWHKCSVETITEECAQSTVKLPQVDKKDCPMDVLLEELVTIACKKTYIQPTLDAVDKKGGCKLIGQAVMEGCGVDKAGKYCTANEVKAVDEVESLITECSGDTNCSSSCTQHLKKFSGDFGCCTNTLFNNTLTGILSPRFEFFSYKKWAQCGVATPGICKIKLN